MDSRFKIILNSDVGSRLFGTNTPDSDHDYMGVCVEPAEYVLGLCKFEQHESQSQPQWERAGPNDYQETIYSLRKFCSLALKGNPSILVLLYAPSPSVVTDTGRMLQSLHACFHSRHVANAFLGYMRQQRNRLEEGTVKARVNRPELVEKYGYDTKYAYHLIRLGIQGVDICVNSKIQLPMREWDINVLMGIRNGEWSKERCIETSLDLELRIESLKAELPDEPAHDIINDFLIKTYMTTWRDIGIADSLRRDILHSWGNSSDFGGLT